MDNRTDIHLIDNPFTPNRPAKGSAFIGREDALGSIRDSLGQSPVETPLVICGPPGIGKTSLLHQLVDGVLDDQIAVLYADLEAMDSSNFSGFLWQLAKAIMAGLEVANVEAPAIEKRMLVLNPQLVFRQRFWNPLLARAQSTPLLIAWDNFDALSKPMHGSHTMQSLRVYLYDLLKTDAPVDLLVTITGRVEALEKNVLSPFELRHSHRLTNLSREQTVELAQQHDESAMFGPVANFIFDLTSGHPGDTQQLCHALYERQHSLGHHLATIADVVAVLQQSLSPSVFVGNVYRRLGRSATRLP